MCVCGGGKSVDMHVSGLCNKTGDTHTEDVEAHSSINTLLGGEVILGELVDRCRKTHKWRKCKKTETTANMISTLLKRKSPNTSINSVTFQTRDVTLNQRSGHILKQSKQDIYETGY